MCRAARLKSNRSGRAQIYHLPFLEVSTYCVKVARLNRRDKRPDLSRLARSSIIRIDTMKRFIPLAICAICTVAQASPPFSSIIVFGDSLSDSGNISSATFGLQPGANYYDGRFSNGPVYSELLADAFQLGPLLPSRNGGDNYAFGGARTSGTSFFEGGFLISDLDDQIDEFLSERQVDEESLFVVFSGANDFVLGGQTNPSIPAVRIQSEWERLIGAGVRNILSINLPLLGLTPRFTATAESMSALTAEFNSLLAESAAEVRLQHPQVDLRQLDLGQLFELAVAVPSAYGFSNVTEIGQDVSDATGFLFWDDVHPTTTAHDLLSRAAYNLYDTSDVIGDLNFNRQLDPSDIDILGYGIVSGSTHPWFDINRDESVSTFDFDAQLQVSNVTNGDIDISGLVDFDDFLTLARNFGASGDGVLWSSGDLNISGSVEFSDFLTLSRNFGPRTSVVPESTCPLWVSLCCLAFTRLLHHRRA